MGCLVILISKKAVGLRQVRSSLGVGITDWISGIDLVITRNKKMIIIIKKIIKQMWQFHI